ncbi:MAG: glycosyltransferase [Ectothiorhodospiraceae bacterium]|jgi:glycosyltransferase involved in cell wall biosynthesis
MKTIHVLGSHQLGGADKFYVRLIEALNGAGHEAVAVNRPGAPVARVLDTLGIRQHHLPLANKWDVVSVARLRRLIRNEKPDAVQTYMGRATRLTRVPGSLGVPHVARLGGYYKINGYYEHCDAWVGNTRGVCDYLVREGLPASRVYLIGNFVAPASRVPAAYLDSLRGRLDLPDDARVLFALGRFVDVKGFDVMLQALERLPREMDGRPLHALIVGDGPLREPLTALAAQLGVEDRVHWAGWHDDPEAFFHLADILICPSRHETLGNVILEGWNHDLPVVSTTTAGAREIVTDGVNGLLAPIDHPGALASRIQDALRLDGHGRGELVRAGRETLDRHHGREAVVAAYIDMYTQLRGRRRSARA